MICSWNAGKKSFVEKQKGEIDCLNAGLENNNGKLRPWKVTHLVRETWRKQDLRACMLVYGRRCIGQRPGEAK